jgi:hypothetical protein
MTTLLNEEAYDIYVSLLGHVHQQRNPHPAQVAGVGPLLFQQTQSREASHPEEACSAELAGLAQQMPEELHGSRRARLGELWRLWTPRKCLNRLEGNGLFTRDYALMALGKVH